MWSGPRNLSTAMMRGFSERADCEVWDEPFFAAYLKVSGKQHPGRAETLARHEANEDLVAAGCRAHTSQNYKKQYSFQKHMAHHMLPGFKTDWYQYARHFFLIREPERVIASYIKGRSEFTLEDLGFAALRRVYSDIEVMTGVSPPIIDSMDILRNPETALRAICAAINIPFDTGMLSWAPGPRPEDGAWAPYWYKSVENSTGFGPPPTHMPDIPDEYADILAKCRVDYDYFYERRLRV